MGAERSELPEGASGVGTAERDGDASQAPAEPRPARRTRGMVVAIVVVGAAVGLLWVSLSVLGGTGLPADPSGLRAPAFTMPRLDGGGPVSLSSFRGKPVVLNFWASWCGPCKQEAPILAAGAEKWMPQGVVFLGADSEDTTAAARAFEERFGIPYDSAFDPEGRLELRYGVTGFPETFFIDAHGVIRAKYVGPLDAASLQTYVSSIARG